MLVSTTLASLVVLSTVTSGVQEAEPASYRLKFAPAKFAFEQIARLYNAESTTANQFVKDDNKVWLDESQNRIFWSKKTEDIADLCELFDVRRVSMEVHLVVYSPYFNQSWKSVSTIYNNETFEYSDKSFDVQFQVTPRINGDGTVTARAICSGGLYVYDLPTTMFKDDTALSSGVTWRAVPDSTVDVLAKTDQMIGDVKEAFKTRRDASAKELYYGVSIRFSGKEVEAIANAVEGGCFGGE